MNTTDGWCMKGKFALVNANCIDFSPDGAYFVTGSVSGTVGLWDTSKMLMIKSYNFGPSVRQVAFSKNQSYIAVGGDQDRIHILNGSNLKLLKSFSSGLNKVFDLDFSFNSNRLVACGEKGYVNVFNVPNWDLLISNPNIEFDSGVACEFRKGGPYMVSGRHSFI